jgi:hypothetical protein
MTYERSMEIRRAQIEEARRSLGIVQAALAAPPVDNSRDTLRQSRAERARNKPGRFWARSSAGVYMNQQRRRNNGY